MQLSGQVGVSVDLVDNNEVIGIVVKTKNFSPPIFVSIGHKINLKDAVKFV